MDAFEPLELEFIIDFPCEMHSKFLASVFYHNNIRGSAFGNAAFEALVCAYTDAVQNIAF